MKKVERSCSRHEDGQILLDFSMGDTGTDGVLSGIGSKMEIFYFDEKYIVMERKERRFRICEGKYCTYISKIIIEH